MAKEKWLGGYKRVEADGRTTFIIERRVNGERFHRSTHCHLERAALKQLERFEADPMGYRPEGQQETEPLRMTPERVDEFAAWQVEVRGNTKRHAFYVSKYLKDWLKDLGGRDLRHLTLGEHVIPKLDARKGARAHRIAALKAFYAWLRTEKHLLTSADDCTRDLLVPQSRIAKQTKKKAVDRATVQRILPHLDERYRDVLLFAACTGWHKTELERFVRDPESELIHLSPEQIARDGCIAVARTWHKGKTWTATAIRTQQHLDAAVRMRAYGRFPRNFNQELKRVAVALGGDPQTGAPLYFPIGVMRHSFATWHSGAGADTKHISVALDHKSERTTAAVYIDLAIPRSNLPPIEFELTTLH